LIFVTVDFLLRRAIEIARPNDILERSSDSEGTLDRKRGHFRHFSTARSSRLECGLEFYRENRCL